MQGMFELIKKDADKAFDGFEIVDDPAQGMEGLEVRDF